MNKRARMNKKSKAYKNSFTLIELLAVMVILAVILAISVPTILGVIKDAKKSTMESDAKLVIDAIEKRKALDETFDPEIISIVSFKETLGLSDNNYSSITVTVVDGKISVSIIGKGQWNGLIASGTKDNITVETYVEEEPLPPVTAFYSMQPNATNVTCDSGNLANDCLSEITLFPYNFTPTGYLKCDGTLLPVASNVALYSLIGNMFGGSGSDFALPNLTSEAPLTGIEYYMSKNGFFPSDSSATPISNGNYYYYSYQTTSRYYFLGEIRLASNIDYAANNMLPCDGRLLSMTSYAALYSLIGDIYGGDGRTNFALPDLSDAVPPVTGAQYYMVTNGIFPSRP